MENVSYHVPFYIVDAGVATTGHSSEMASKKVGLFARSTFNVSTGVSTEKELFFAQAPNGGKDWYGRAVSGTHKSPFFMVDDVEDIYVSLPQELQNEEYIIGYNGAASSKGFTFEKGVALRVKFLFSGEPTYRFFGGPKEYLVSHTPKVDCSTQCDTGDCSDDSISDAILEMKELIGKINNHTELQKFGVRAFLTFPEAVDEGTGGTVTATRTLKITLKRNADGSDRLDEFEAWIGGIDGVDIESLAKVAGAGTTTEGIADDYTVEQTSYEEADAEGALSNNVTFRYAHVPAIEGVAWSVESETTVADTAAASAVAGRKVGIRVSAGYYDPKFGDCSFDPKDYYETMPVKFEISLYNEDEDRCDVSKWPSVLKTKEGQIDRQSGEWVAREILMKEDAYLKHINKFSLDPREREAFEMKQLSRVDRNAHYKLYYVRYKASYGNNSFRKNEQERFTTVFAVKESDTTNDTALNTNIIDVLETRTGITMHTNG